MSLSISSNPSSSNVNYGSLNSESVDFYQYSRDSLDQELEEDIVPSAVIDTTTDAETAGDFGVKDIGVVFSICLLLNNITGPGMVQYPALFQQAGWIAPIITMLICATLSAVSGLCLLKAMAVIPKNHQFELRYEFLNIAEHYSGRKMYRFTIIFFLLSLYASVVPMIIQSGQVMDFLAVEITGKTCGVELYPNPGWSCASNTTDIDPFGGGVVVISVGLVLLAALCVPIGYLNLDDNRYIQYGAAFMLWLIVIFWVSFFSDLGLDASRIPAFGTNFSQVLGLVVFNYTFVTCLPSWVNEKSNETKIAPPVYISLFFATLMFIFIGLFGALAYDPILFSDGNNILERLYQSTNKVARVSYYLFPLVADLTSIPVFSIVIRYNLLANHLCGKKFANLLAVVMPWLITVPFYTGAGFARVIAWTGILVNGIVNFIIPFYIYIKSVRKYEVNVISQNLLVQEELMDFVLDWEDPISSIVNYFKLERIGSANPKIFISYCAIGIFTVMLFTVIVVDIYYAAIGISIV